ncbi:glycoside hydrolase family 172 protein [Polymorphospora sp. NPDC050346]|uniref:glycoside hydrolase family 172 protein n=1 Tax=Polymorphospora sp. NPDC050346 TaxID=3155780 RepID=UPI0033F327BC
MYLLPKNVASRSVTAENPTGEPGAGGRANNGRKGRPCIEPLSRGQSVTLLEATGPGVVRRIWCTLPPGDPDHLRNVILRMYWNGCEYPSVEVPIGDFFGLSHGQQRPLHTACVAMQGATGFNCWIPMPFHDNARITVTNESSTDVAMFFYQVDYTLGDDLAAAGLFHASFRRQNPVPLGEDFVILDAGGGPGVFLGTVIGIRSLYTDKTEWWGEGEVKFYLDGETFPTICGTGTEDYIGSAWGTPEVVSPYQGAPLVDDEAGLYSLYRFHVPDPIYFDSSLRVTIQQLGAGSRATALAALGDASLLYRAAGTVDGADVCLFERSDDYSAVAFWYQSTPARLAPLPPSEDRVRDLPPTTGLIQ